MIFEMFDRTQGCLAIWVDLEEKIIDLPLQKAVFVVYRAVLFFIDCLNSVWKSRKTGLAIFRSRFSPNVRGDSRAGRLCRRFLRAMYGH